jgi:hypothetical protein
MGEQASQQNFIHPPAKPFDPIDDDHGHAFVVSSAQIWITVDIDLGRR